jgi:MscS family membrane protein
MADPSVSVAISKLDTFIDCLGQARGISLVQWSLAFAVMLMSIFMRRFLAQGVVALLRKINPDSSQLREALFLALLKPLSFTIVIFGFHVGGAFLQLPDALAGPYGKILNTLITYTFFWAIYRLVAPLAVASKNSMIFKGKMSEEIHDVVFRLSRAVVFVLGLMTILELWNVNVFAFVASLGLLGMAVALAAQNTLKNLFGSLTILTDHALKKGDRIKTPDVEGIVENIGFRATAIRQTDKALVTVPNAKLAEAAVVNFSRMPLRLVRFTLALDVKTPPASLRQLIHEIKDYLQNQSPIETDPRHADFVICIDQVTDTSITLLCHFYIKSLKWNEFMQLKELYTLGVLDLLPAHQVNLAVSAWPSVPSV